MNVVDVRSASHSATQRQKNENMRVFVRSSGARCAGGECYEKPIVLRERRGGMSLGPGWRCGRGAEGGGKAENPKQTAAAVNVITTWQWRLFQKCLAWLRPIPLLNAQMPFVSLAFSTTMLLAPNPPGSRPCCSMPYFPEPGVDRESHSDEANKYFYVVFRGHIPGTYTDS